MFEASYGNPYTGLDGLVRAILITGEISNFFGILHICRLYCFAIPFHSDGKCRNLPTLHGVKTTYLLVSVA